jgi:hypothetical protein
MAQTTTAQPATVYEIVGVAHRSGNFNGADYSNIQFHTVIPFADNKGVGMKVDVKKTKVAMLSEVFGKPTTVDEVMQMVGKLVNFHYDEYGNVNLIREFKA